MVALVIIAIVGVAYLSTHSYQAPAYTSTTTSSTTTAQQGNYAVSIVNAPASVLVGKPFTITWKVDSPVQKTIAHTAIHYGPRSVPNPTAPSDYPLTPDIKSGVIPGTFSIQFTITPTGTYYYRAHAIIDGQNVWSDERMITVTGQTS